MIRDDFFIFSLKPLLFVSTKSGRLRIGFANYAYPKITPYCRGEALYDRQQCPRIQSRRIRNKHKSDVQIGIRVFLSAICSRILAEPMI